MPSWKRLRQIDSYMLSGPKMSQRSWCWWLKCIMGRIFPNPTFQLPSFSLDVTTDVTEDLSSNDKIDVPSMAPVAPASKAPLKENSMIFNDLQSLLGFRDLSNWKPKQKRCRPWVRFLMFHCKGRDWNKRIRWLVSQTLWDAWMQDRILRHCQNFGHHALQRAAVSCGHVISLWVSACNKDCYGLDTLRW